MICKYMVMLGMSMGLTSITACKTHHPIAAEHPGGLTPEPSIMAESEGHMPHIQQPEHITIDTVAVPEKPADGIYGENSDIPDSVNPPTYPGGLAALSQFLSDNIKYPKEAEKANITGRVLVGFIVDVDGAISESRVEHSTHPLLDREALRVIRLMPAWNPAKEKATGKPVKVRYHLPVTFKL